MSNLILDHISGEGVRRNSKIDYGMMCPVCGRTTYVFCNDEKDFYIGCAYAIGGGLCQNYHKLDQRSLNLLLQNPESFKHMMMVFGMLEKQSIKKNKEIFAQEDKMRNKCVFVVPGATKRWRSGVRGVPYCMNQSIIDRKIEDSKAPNGSPPWRYGICLPSSCREYRRR